MFVTFEAHILPQDFNMYLPLDELCFLSPSS